MIFYSNDTLLWCPCHWVMWHWVVLVLSWRCCLMWLCVPSITFFLDFLYHSRKGHISHQILKLVCLWCGSHKHPDEISHHYGKLWVVSGILHIGGHPLQLGWPVLNKLLPFIHHKHGNISHRFCLTSVLTVCMELPRAFWPTLPCT